MPLSQYSNAFHQLLKDARYHSVVRGDTIVTTENIRGIFCVEIGFVKRFLIRNDGSISVQGIYGPRDCFGMMALSRLLISNSYYKGSEIYYYEAISDNVVSEIDNDTLLATLPNNPGLYKDFFTIQGWHSLSNIWRLENQGLENAAKRVAHILCFYIDRYGKQTKGGWELKVPLTQQDLADILDLSRETVSLAIGELKKLNLLTNHRRITVSDINALKSLAYS